MDELEVKKDFTNIYTQKTPYSYLLSRTKAIEEAAIVALRDAGAKLMLDFFRIPAINGWMQQRSATKAEA